MDAIVAAARAQSPVEAPVWSIYREPAATSLRPSEDVLDNRRAEELDRASARFLSV